MYYSPLEGIRVEYTEVEGIPAMGVVITEKHLASWSEWMPKEVVLYLYDDDDTEDVIDFTPDDDMLEDDAV